MTSRRSLHLGLDYGTSASKLMLRDFAAPGGERAFPVSNGNNFRISSSILQKNGSLIFGQVPSQNRDDGIWFESVKMRVATEHTRQPYCVSAAVLPDDLTAADLATLTVWWLLTIGHRAAIAHLQLPSEREGELALSFTMGIPMSFHVDRGLRSLFVRIAGLAGYLLKQAGPLIDDSISIDEATQALDEARHTSPESAFSDELVRSEAQAAVWFTYQSPKVGQGPYAKIDIGAGTTNVSIFRLHGDIRARSKDALNVYSATSSIVGMDTVDASIAECYGVSDVLMFRGAEARHFDDPGVTAQCQGVLHFLYQAFANSWRLAYPKIRGLPLEFESWLGSCRLFLIGGGSLVPAIRSTLERHPADGRRLDLVELDPPDDLRDGAGRGVDRQQLPFMLVAYGLSDPSMQIQELRAPDDIDDGAPLPLMETQKAQVCSRCRGFNESCFHCHGSGLEPDSGATARTVSGNRATPTSIRLASVSRFPKTGHASAQASPRRRSSLSRQQDVSLLQAVLAFAIARRIEQLSVECSVSCVVCGALVVTKAYSAHVDAHQLRPGYQQPYVDALTKHLRLKRRMTGSTVMHRLPCPWCNYVGENVEAHLEQMHRNRLPRGGRGRWG